mmetsp:Transcript_36119/g.55465  ORF Transcript_36119/g.55465 Transcript_36119/m.55465 type:complete len:369 (+) Transcript_36119:300-1406(+)
MYWACPHPTLPFISVGCGDGQMALFQFSTNASKQLFPPSPSLSSLPTPRHAHAKAITSGAICPNAKDPDSSYFVVTCSLDNCINLWHVGKSDDSCNNVSWLATWRKPNKKIHSVVVKPIIITGESLLMIVAGHDSGIVVLEANPTELMSKKNRHAAPPLSLLPFASKEIHALLSEFGTNLETGLDETQVEQRLALDGKNTIKMKEASFCQSWISCFGCSSSSNKQRQLVPQFTEVYRNGGSSSSGSGSTCDWSYVKTTNLVCGDVIRLAPTDRIPADCVVVHLIITSSLSSDEEMLVDYEDISDEEGPRSVTSESSYGDARLFCGGLVVQGIAIAVVTKTGRNTLLATLVRSEKPLGSMPLQEVLPMM